MNEKKKVYISLTTIKSREDICQYTLISLLSQSVLPDLIVVNISRDAYLLDEGFAELPHWPQFLINNPLIKINLVENSGPYRKLIPVMELAGQDDCVITVDDDVIYPKRWLHKLLLAEAENPDDIICFECRAPVYNVFGKLCSYTYWPKVKMNSKGAKLLPIGIGGVMYKKKLLDLKFLNGMKFKEIAPTADDLWFKTAHFLKGVNVFVADKSGLNFITLPHTSALSQSNVGAKMSGLNNLIKHVLAKIAGYFNFRKSGNDLILDNIRKYVGKNNGDFWIK